MKIKKPKYLKEFLKKHPRILSGRKNFNKYHLKINKTLKLIDEYLKKS